MSNRASTLAGTALALILGAAHAAASGQDAIRAPIIPDATPMDRQHILLAQTEEGETDEEELLRLRRQLEEEEEPAPEAPEDVQPPADAPEPPAPEERPQAPEEAPAPPTEQDVPPLPEEAPPVPEEAPAPPPQEETPPAPEDTQPAPEEQPAEEAVPPVIEEEPPVPEEAPVPPVQEETPPTPAPEDVQPAPEEPPAEEPAPPVLEEEPPVPEEAPVPPTLEETPPTPAPDDAQPAPEEQPADEAAPPVQEDAAPAQQAPVLDSEKEAVDTEQQPGAAAPPPPAEALPPPTSDQEAQQEAQPAEITSVREEEGRRVERRERQRERREGEDVVREIGDRIVIQLNNQVVVRSDDSDRLGRGASEVYYEELPRGRTRETIVRPNGVQIVTVRDRYGDVIRRSRIMPDGREYVLVYADGRDRDEWREWRDPGRELPPLRLTIPYEDYVLDAGRVQDPDVYYEFLHQPPVERVQRLYTIDEVRYSARLRDSVRRVELDTITFDFGSASIAEDAVMRLEGVADAMSRLLDDNPAETFLIEGHTDAVGSDEANLALSDRRAEAVAAALTNVFDIPPENLVTQGYGERYLKVETQEPERQNRRVVMRRITPLVAPVASR